MEKLYIFKILFLMKFFFNKQKYKGIKNKINENKLILIRKYSIL